MKKVQEEITLKNTKAEILDALNQALEREKEKNLTKSNPEKEEHEQKIKTSIENSKKNVEQNIFSSELINKFKDLETAIEAEEEKLKNLYGVEKELNNLTLVANAGKDYINDLENKKKTEEEKLNISIENLSEEYKKKSDELKEEYELKAKSLKMEREREIENNIWEDNKKKKEEELKQKEIETNTLLADAKANATHLKELEQQVADIPNIMEKEYQRGKTEITKELEKEHKYETELLKKDYQNTIDRQVDKIKSLNEEIEKLTNLNISLQEKMDKAYNEIKELAAKTVEASGGVKILGNNQSNNKE